MAVAPIHEYLMHAAYFAPRGQARLIELGRSLANRYLAPQDKLIGLIGDAGAGKSLLIRGMFSGLDELSAHWRAERVFQPQWSRERAAAQMAQWEHAVRQTIAE